MAKRHHPTEAASVSPEGKPLRWLDTHTHLSGLSPDGTPRMNLAGDLLAVLGASEADLRFVMSPDLGAEMDAMIRGPEGVLEASRFVHLTVRQAPGRLYGACMVNPHFLDASLETMDVCFGEWGFLLLGEMLQYIMHYRMNSDPVARLVRQAVAFDVPVQVHISTSNIAQGRFTSGVEEMHDFLDLVERVPEARYLLAHFVGSPKNNPPVVSTYLDIIEERLGRWPETFWAEIMHFHSPGVPVALTRIPHDRLMAGTDWCTHLGPPFLPYGIVYGVTDPAANPYPPGVAALAGFLREAGVSEATLRAIAWENAARLLKLNDTAQR